MGWALNQQKFKSKQYKKLCKKKKSLIEIQTMFPGSTFFLQCFSLSTVPAFLSSIFSQIEKIKNYIVLFFFFSTKEHQQTFNILFFFNSSAFSKDTTTCLFFSPVFLFLETATSHKSFLFHQWKADLLRKAVVQLLVSLEGLPVIFLLMRRLSLARWDLQVHLFKKKR